MLKKFNNYMRRLPLFQAFKSPKKLLQLRTIFHLIFIATIIYICYIFGVFTHLLEKDLSEFRHPLKIDVRCRLYTKMEIQLII